MTDKKTSNKEKALSAALAQIERQFGKGSIMKLGADNPIAEIEYTSPVHPPNQFSLSYLLQIFHTEIMATRPISSTQMPYTLIIQYRLRADIISTSEIPIYDIEAYTSLIPLLLQHTSRWNSKPPQVRFSLDISPFQDQFGMPLSCHELKTVLLILQLFVDNPSPPHLPHILSSQIASLIFKQFNKSWINMHFLFSLLDFLAPSTKFIVLDAVILILHYDLAQIPPADNIYRFIHHLLVSIFQTDSDPSLFDCHTESNRFSTPLGEQCWTLCVLHHNHKLCSVISDIVPSHTEEPHIYSELLSVSCRQQAIALFRNVCSHFQPKFMADTNGHQTLFDTVQTH
jgi:hypothetical protein